MGVSRLFRLGKTYVRPLCDGLRAGSGPTGTGPDRTDRNQTRPDRSDIRGAGGFPSRINDDGSWIKDHGSKIKDQRSKIKDQRSSIKDRIKDHGSWNKDQ